MKLVILTAMLITSATLPVYAEPTNEQKALSCSAFYFADGKVVETKFGLSSEKIRSLDHDVFQLKGNRKLRISATPLARGVTNVHVTWTSPLSPNDFYWNGQSVTETVDGRKMSGLVGFQSNDFSFHCFAF